MSETMIEMKLVITNKLNSKSPWLPETQVVEGHTFVKLERLGRDFTRYVSGRSLDLRPANSFSLNGSYLHKMVMERNKESESAYFEVVVQDSQDDLAVDAKPKKRKVKEGDGLLCPPMVHIDLPPATGFSNKKVMCLWGVGAMPLWVEAAAEFLEHIRAGILEAGDDERRTPAPKRRRVSNQ